MNYLCFPLAYLLPLCIVLALAMIPVNHVSLPGNNLGLERSPAFV